MNLRFFKMLDISTGHIEENDVTLLESDKENHCFSVTEYEEGFFLNLHNVDVSRLSQDCAAFSHHFQTVLRIAKENSCEFINFDRDGQLYEGLPVFDW